MRAHLFVPDPDVPPWPPPGWRLARGEGPAKAEYEEHLRRAQAVAAAWQQRPRGRRSE